MYQRRWIKLTSIYGRGIRSLIPLPNPSLFISVNGLHKHTARSTRSGRRIPSWENHLENDPGLSPVWKSPVWIDLENEPDLVLEFDLMVEGNLRYVRDHERHYGEVNVPVNDLLQAEGPHGSLCRHVSYQIRSPVEGRPNGTLSFSYQIHQPPPPRQPPVSKHLPPHIYLSAEVVSAILSKLSAKALMKFRCVCKSWNYLIHEDPYFAAQHSNNSKLKPTFVSLSETRVWKGNEDALCDFSYDYTLNYTPYNGSKIRKIAVTTDHHGYYATNSCNGLVGVYGRDVFYVANPSIMKLTTLPRGSPHVGKVSCSTPLAGIGFESLTTVYKAVRLFVRKFEQYRPVSVGCEVFSFGGRSWKSVEDPPEPFRYMEQGYKFQDPSVVDGAMYWTVIFDVVRISPGLILSPEIALSFDLREEKFSVLLHPERSSRPKESSLVTIQGRLCIVDTLKDPNRMKIWTLKDRRRSEWVKQYAVDLSRMCPRIMEGMGMLSPLTIDGRRIVLLCCNNKIYHDLISMRIVHHTRTDHVDCEFIRPYTESIVWPFCN